MYKEILTICCCAVLSTAAFSDICPSVKAVKTGKATGWRAYDSDDDKPLSNIRTAKFRKAISRFSIAEWSESKHKNSIHCYYSNNDGSTLEAYFARDHYLPNIKSRYWYKVTGLLQCAAGADKCDFTPETKEQKRLAEADLDQVAS
jgi:hypothetical protein